jgi:hypothetical protein
MLLCSITEQDHANQASTNLGYEAYIDYAAQLRDDLSAAAKQQHATPSQLPDISIRHFPLDICALDATCFVLPAASGAVALGRCAAYSNVAREPSPPACRVRNSARPCHITASQHPHAVEGS